MGQKRTNKPYSKEYKEEAVALIRDQGYTVPEAAKSLGIESNILYRWKDKIASDLKGKSLSTDEREELIRLRKENKNLRMEKEILKKGECRNAASLLRERNEIRFGFIKEESTNFPVIVLCRVMQVSTSAFYAWRKRPGKLIDADVLNLHRRIKSLFKQSRNSLGSRELMKNLRKEGIAISRYKVSKLMKTGFNCTQRVAYKVTTIRRHYDDVSIA